MCEDRYIVSLPVDEEKISLGEDKCFGEVHFTRSRQPCTITTSNGLLCATSGEENISTFKISSQTSVDKLRGQKPTVFS